MAFSWHLADDDRVLVTAYAGVVTAADLRNSQEERAELIRTTPSLRYLLNDYSSADRLDIPMEAVIGNAEGASAKLAEIAAELRLAFVVPAGLAHGLARVWIAHVETSGWRVRIFRGRDEAEAWLRDECGSPLTFR